MNPSVPNLTIGMVRKLDYARQSELYPFPAFNVGRSYERMLQEFVPRFSEPGARLASLLGDELFEYRP
jgi:hypothetical protein